MRIAMATCRDTPEGRIWCPPNGKPFWVTGPKCPPYKAGPELSDAEMARYFAVTKGGEG